MSIQLYGGWHLKIIKAIHNWENRFVIEGAAAGNGVYPPTVGLEVTASGSAWQLRAEYRESAAESWKPSAMIISSTPDRVDIQATIGAEDPLPHPDYEDIQWDARYLDGTIIEIPYRPWAVRIQDLFEIPDGIFETSLGTCYMAVRVRNRWGLPFTESHVLDITPQSRAQLAARGIVVLDAWSNAELAALGQQQASTGIVLGPLAPGSSKTVFFKVDISGAAPRKHEVEFVCWNTLGMADPGHPARRVRKKIFVSRTTIDSATGEVVSEVRQGTLRFNLRQFGFDQKTARKGRKRRPAQPLPDDAPTRDELRRTLRALLDGRAVDPCVIQRILTCYCSCRPPGSTDPSKPGDGRFTYDPFYAFPTKFTYTITPRPPFQGQYGPIPFDDPWWKVLLLIIAFLLWVAGALEDAANTAYHDEDLIIGTLKRWQQNDVDAALCLLDTDRALGFLEVLDAQSDEDNQNAEVALDGTIPLASNIMTRAEATALITNPATPVAQLRVFKSGAMTGLTHGLMVTTTAAPFTRSDDGTLFSIPQLVIGPDTAFGENVSQKGDSGSIWVHQASRRPVALHHSGSDNPDRATASFLEDVFAALSITV